MGDDVCRAPQRPQALLAFQVPGDEHAGGQLGPLDLPLVNETVSHIGHVVRGHNARQLQYAEPRPAEVHMVCVGGDDHVRQKALLQEVFVALAIGQGHIVGPVRIGIHGDARLDDLGRRLAAVPLLQVADVACVVKVGVGAQNPPQPEPVVLNKIRQGAAVQLGVSRVHQHNVRVRQLIYRHQRRGPHGGIGPSVYVPQLHISSPSMVQYSILYTLRREKTTSEKFPFTPYAKPEK